MWRPPLWWLGAAVVFSASGTYLLRKRPHAAFALGALVLFVAGALAIQTRSSGKTNQFGVPPFAEGRDVMVTGHVIKEGTLQRGFGDVQQKLDVETEVIENGSDSVSRHCGVRVSLYSKQLPGENESSVHLFRYGERLRFATRLNAPHNFRNPGAFDYQEYLGERGITALASAKAENVESLPGFFGNRVELWRTRIHHSVSDRIHLLWPPREAALADALLIGENTFLSRDVLTEFQRTGTYHVLVISGLKVAILALVTYWLLRRMQVGNLLASAITVSFAIFYALLTDVGAPVWRATLMLVVYLGARLFYRQRSALNTIGVAALALLMVDPGALFGASFQLSFLCVLIIVAIGIPILERTTHPLSQALRNLEAISYDGKLLASQAQIRLDLRMIAGRLQRFAGTRVKGVPLVALAVTARALLLACEFLVISIVLQIGFTLPMAYYFHRATLVSLPANILAVPLTEITIVAALLAVGLTWVSFSVAHVPATVAKLALEALAGSVHWLGHLQIADTRLPTPRMSSVLLVGLTLLLAMALARRHALLSAAGMLLVAGGAFWICVFPPHPLLRSGVLEVTAVDVGQGDSILVVSPLGRTLLVDAGGLPHWMHSDLDIGEDVVSPYLWSRGISRLDAVAITHAHADHIGGMAAILANFRPHELWIGVDSASPELQALLGEARQLSIAVVARKAGEDFESGGARFQVLAPAAGTEIRASRANDESLVMKVKYGNTSALLEGDAEKPTERQIMEEDAQADLLKVAHHGSATSTIPELLAAVKPLFAVISVGARNTYGHPRIEVLNRLAESHVLTYRTDLDGAVTFYLDGKTVTPQLAALR